MTMETSTPSDAEEFVCPEAEYHGNPFRYCPVKGCGWIEDSDADSDVVTSPSLAERLAMVERTVSELVAATNTQNELLQQIRDAVEPAIEGIKNSAVGSMLGIR